MTDELEEDTDNMPAAEAFQPSETAQKTLEELLTADNTHLHIYVETLTMLKAHAYTLAGTLFELVHNDNFPKPEEFNLPKYMQEAINEVRGSSKVVTNFKIGEGSLVMYLKIPIFKNMQLVDLAGPYSEENKEKFCMEIVKLVEEDFLKFPMRTLK